MFNPRLIGCLVRAGVVAGGLAIVGCASESKSSERLPSDISQKVERVMSVDTVLDGLHDAAAKADEKRYFDHFAPGAVFLGTDARERWTLEEFRAYAHARVE